MNRLRLSGLLAVTLAFAMPALAGNVSVPTARGEVAVPATPSRVAVFDVAAIDTLLALGVTPAGIPSRLYVDYLAGLEATPVGTLFEPDLEALAALGPDLIIVGGRSAPQAEALAPIAPVIDMTIATDIPAEGRARIEAYGTLFGRQAEAAVLAAAYDARLAEAQEAVAGQGRALIVQTNGPKISAYGKGSRFGWLHSTLGLPEAHEQLDPATHGDAVSFEFIAEADPDWLIVIDRGAAIGEAGSAASTLDNPLVAGTKAGKAGRIVYLSAAPVYIAGGGYTAMTRTLDEITAAFRAR